MPATSKKQQRFFGMLDSIRKGEMKNPPENLKRLAYSMKHDSIRDYARTKHTNLPDKVAEDFLAAGFVKAALDKGMSQADAEELLKVAWLPLLAGAARAIPGLVSAGRAALPFLGNVGKGMWNFAQSPFGKGLSLGSLIPGPGLFKNLFQNNTQTPQQPPKVQSPLPPHLHNVRV